MRIIKMLAKIAAISVAVVIFMFTVTILFVLLAQRGEGTGRNGGTGETKEMSISYEFTGKLPDFSKSEEDIPDDKYYESVEEAIKHKVFSEGMEYLTDINEVIAKLESETYVSIFYVSVKNKKTECFTACKLKVKEFDGVKKYAYLFAYPTESKKNAWYMGDSTSVVRTSLDFSEFKKNMSVDGKNKRFIWGFQPFKNIYTLKVEGQEPTEIIPYDEFGKTRYFWYFKDLKSDKPGHLLEYEMEVLKDYKKDL